MSRNLEFVSQGEEYLAASLQYRGPMLSWYSLPVASKGPLSVEDPASQYMLEFESGC
jgi:hypothetical protein